MHVLLVAALKPEELSLEAAGKACGLRLCREPLRESDGEHEQEEIEPKYNNPLFLLTTESIQRHSTETAD